MQICCNYDDYTRPNLTLDESQGAIIIITVFTSNAAY